MRRDEEGVASVIGTIMALLIFLTFMSMFVNTYIPIWMKENERLHMNEVQNQMGEVKGKIDNLIVNAQVTGTSMVNTYEPITLGADGIPLFASATAGGLFLRPSGTGTTSTTVQFNYTSNGKVTFSETGGGKLEFYAPNRYYVGQWLAYENGALIVKQDVGEAMKASPSLEVTKSGSTFNVEFTQIDIVGTNSTMSGNGVAGVNINLIYLDSQKYTPHWNNQNTTVYKFNTVYHVALMDFMNKTIKAADPLATITATRTGTGVGSVYSVVAANAGVTEMTVTDTMLADKSHMVTLQIINTGTLTLSRAFVQVDINV